MESAGDDGVDFERVGRLDQRGKDVSGGNDEQRDFLAEAFGDGDGLGEDHLLVLGEDLVFGAEIFGSAGAHHADGEDDYILLVGVWCGRAPI